MDRRAKAAVILGLAGYSLLSRVVFNRMTHRDKVKAIEAENQRQMAAIDFASLIVNGKIAKGDYDGRTEMDVHRDKLFYIQMIREGL